MGLFSRLAVAAAGGFALMLGSLAAQAGSITTGDNAGRDNYVASLNSQIAGYRAESAAAMAGVDPDSVSRTMWYSADKPNELFGNIGFTAADTNWSKASLRIYDLYVALGGNPSSLRQLFQQRPGLYYVSLDSVGAKWFTTANDAHGHLLKLLIGRSVEMPAGVKSAIADLDSDDLETVVATTRDTLAQRFAFIARGTTVDATITGSGFSNANGTPIVETRDGIVVHDVQFVTDAVLTAKISITAEARLGPASLAIFNVGETMNPVDSAGLFVAAGSGVPTMPADDHGDIVASASALALGGSAIGRIDTPDDEDLFQVVLGAGGTLTLTSGGGTDLTASLEDASGTVLATGDDEGSGLNFQIIQALTADAYYLRVSHCCGGGGSYSVSAGFAP